MPRRITWDQEYKDYLIAREGAKVEKFETLVANRANRDEKIDEQIARLQAKKANGASYEQDLANARAALESARNRAVVAPPAEPVTYV